MNVLNKQKLLRNGENPKTYLRTLTNNQEATGKNWNLQHKHHVVVSPKPQSTTGEKKTNTGPIIKNNTYRSLAFKDNLKRIGSSIPKHIQDGGNDQMENITSMLIIMIRVYILMNGTPDWHKFRYEGIVVKDFYKDNGLRYFNTNKTNENPTHILLDLRFIHLGYVWILPLFKLFNLYLTYSKL